MTYIELMAKVFSIAYGAAEEEMMASFQSSDNPPDPQLFEQAPNDQADMLIAAAKKGPEGLRLMAELFVQRHNAERKH